MEFDEDNLLLLPGHPDLKAHNLKQVIEYRFATQADSLALNFLRDGELDQQDPMTYRELEGTAHAMLAAMRAEGARPGDRVLLLYPSGNAFLAAFVACMLGGMVAVPVALPSGRSQDWQRIYVILADCAPRLILSEDAHFRGLAERLQQDAVPWRGGLIDTDAIGHGASLHPPTHDVSVGELAFLQYTSGSTGNPKGVMVSHGNLIHHQRLLQTALHSDASTRFVSWLPLFHDMGLIGCALHSLYLGTPFHYMSPADFMQKPLRWLHAVSHFGATISGGPNFAYELAVARYDAPACRNLDLSTWTCAFNGAEPLRAETLAKFDRTYAGHGYRRDAHYPCYGLAEAVLMVTAAGPMRGARHARFDVDALAQGSAKRVSEGGVVLVGSGTVMANQRMDIVDPVSFERLPAGRVGEVWVTGPSVTVGYWNKPEVNEATYPVRRQDDGATRRSLRTGDCGFVDESGELFITGRLKDMIVIRGRNVYPQDVEYLVEQVDEALQLGGGAVFGIEHEGEERVVVVHELRRSHLDRIDAPALMKAIRASAARELELNVFDVCLLKPGTLLKTTSGKVQRQRNRQAYLDNKLSVVARHLGGSSGSSASPLPTSGELCREVIGWLQALGRNPAPIKPQDLFVDTGLDSVHAVSLAAHLSKRLGRRVDATLIWQYPEIGEFCEALTRQTPAPQAAVTETKASTAQDVEALSPDALRALIERELLEPGPAA